MEISATLWARVARKGFWVFYFVHIVTKTCYAVPDIDVLGQMLFVFRKIANRVMEKWQYDKMMNGNKEYFLHIYGHVHSV